MPRRQAAESGGHVPGPSGTPDGEFVRLIRDIVRYGDERLTASNAEVDPPRRGHLAGSWPTWSRPATRPPASASRLPRSGSTSGSRSSTCRSAPTRDEVIVLVNPVLLESSGEQKEEEGCLSVPDIAEKVVRPARVRVRAADATGEVREIEGTGLLARALCHETDHLNGTLFVDRLRGLKRELTWRKIHRQKGKGLW